MDHDSGHLLDILSSARMIQSYIESVALDEFLRDTKLQDSVIRLASQEAGAVLEE